MDGESALDGRLRYLEQGSQQLKQQMQVMKSLVTTEVDELKGVLKQQVEDMKAIIVHQDQLYQERIRRLESRVEQLAEFAMHLAQSKGNSAGAIPDTPSRVHHHVGSSGTPLPASRGIDMETPQPGGAHPSDYSAAASGGGGQPQDTLAKYSDKINDVYRHYTETASRALHPVMTLQQFTKFTKDCGLCNSSQGGTVAVNSYLPPPELLWMNVLRRMPQYAGHKKGAKKGAPGSFAFERVQEIHQEHFSDVLAILAEEQYGRNRPDMDPAQVLELFLVNDVFPVTDQKIMAASAQKHLIKEKRHTPRAATSINDYYGSEEIKELEKEYRTKLNNTFQRYVQKGHTIYKRSDKLSLQGFSEVIKDYSLLPLINKAAVREIFLCVMHGADLLAAAEDGQLQEPASGELEIDKKGFLTALRHVAEHIYGERAMAEKYQTPEARYRKLLSKMYLLSS